MPQLAHSTQLSGISELIDVVNLEQYWQRISTPVTIIIITATATTKFCVENEFSAFIVVNEILIS